MPLTKLRILTDRLTGAERRFSLRTLVVLSSLPLFGVVAAFGLAPDTNTLDIAPETITEAISLPTLTPAASAEAYEREGALRPGDTLGDALARLHVDDLEIQRLLAAPALQPVARTLRAGQRLHATTTSEGEVLSVRFERRDGPALTLVRQGEDFVAEDGPAVLESRVTMNSGRIITSLYGATDSAGIPGKIADQMVEAFATRIDFRGDLRRDDTFSVVYTMDYRNGEPVGAGRMLAAEFVNAGKTYRVVLYRDANGRESYYTPEGESLKKGFLRSPLEFTRVTSSFSNSRKHPLYGFHRAHTGVDLGAPTGTRVKVTGDGTVAFAGRRGGYGNLVIVRHGNGYETYYAHLNAFAAGIRAGRAVSQGEIIAYVGSTGAATGPHLHYEVRTAGRPQNPLTVKLPGSPPLPAAQLAQFRDQTAGWSEKLALLRGTNLAALD
jgi:murein DD-endopeptidase MepM/ murein hydrolase activator NlpD